MFNIVPALMFYNILSFNHISNKVTRHLTLDFAIRFTRRVTSEVSKDCNKLGNRPFSKITEKNSNKLKLKTHASTRKNTLTLVTLQTFSILGVIPAKLKS